MSKVFCKVCARDFSLDDAPQSAGPDEVGSNQIETFTENHQRFNTQGIDSLHTQNILINKVIGENEKLCLLFYGKKTHGLFGQPKYF